MPIGPWELALIVVVLLLVFGSRKLPEMGRGLGRGMREFKDSVTGKDEKPERGPQEITATAVEEEAEQPVATPSGADRERNGSS